MLRAILSLGILVLASQALGSSGGEHHDAGIPWEMIKKQAFNFTLVMILLVYVLKSKIAVYFKDRVDNFEKAAVLAKKAKEDAEKQKSEISSRLAQLESTSADSVSRANKEAEELKTKIQNEAQALAKQLRQDAADTAKLEVEKAKHELQDEVLAMAMTQTREHMKTSVKEPDQKRLQNEFVEKIQVIR